MTESNGFTTSRDETIEAGDLSLARNNLSLLATTIRATKTQVLADGDRRDCLEAIGELSALLDHVAPLERERNTAWDAVRHAEVRLDSERARFIMQHRALERERDELRAAVTEAIVEEAIDHAERRKGESIKRISPTPRLLAALDASHD